MKPYILLLLFLSPMLVRAQIINFPDENFKAILLQANTIDKDGDGEISVEEAEDIAFLYLFNGNINDVTGLEYFVNVKQINLGENNLTVLDISALSKLEMLDVDNNKLTSLSLNGAESLIELSCSGNEITELDLEGAPNMEFLVCGVNQIEELDLSRIPNLKILDCSFNRLTGLDFSYTPDLSWLFMSLNPFVAIDFAPLSKLEYLDCTSSHLTSVDLSVCPRLENLNIGYSDSLQHLNIKNGQSLATVSIVENNALEFLCVNDFELERYQMLVDGLPSDCVVNSYCSFVPGGDYYTVVGSTYFSEDGTGGGSQTAYTIPYVRYELSDGNALGYYSSSVDGAHKISMPEGNYTLKPVFDNENLFDFSPNPLTLNFPEDGAQLEQDFYVTPIEFSEEVEVSLLPLTAARPGTEASYKIMYQNKGSVELNGRVELNFQGMYMDLVNAVPQETEFLESQLAWEYENLQPFERREILLDFVLNTPMDSPSVSIDDVLKFSANISPIDSERSDNFAELEQTVVNSQDPNDKTCVEGQYVSQDYIGEYVHYIVRFENLGSAEAINVVIKDVIDADKFDVSSLRLLESSHDLVYRIRDENIVEFIYEDIYLPFEDEENDGYVAFKIKTLLF